MAKQVSKPTKSAPVASVPQVVTSPKAPAFTPAKLAGTTQVVLGPRNYGSKAAHNVAWWAAINKSLGSSHNTVAYLTSPAPEGAAVPGHFVGYCLRKGYLASAPIAA